jgi:endonuclease/exonuclease/phosphatase family metal-dependent hydrolase
MPTASRRKTPIRLFRLSACLAALIGFHGAGCAQALAIDVMSFNVRVPIDPAPHDWASRKARVAGLVRRQHPDFLGVQEAVPAVIADLNLALGEYASVGRGREVDGGGEGTQIFYRKARWDLDAADHGTFQLSSTPEVAGSNDWGLRWPRIATWAHLREHASGRGLYVYNTHFPLKPEERERAARLLANRIADRKHPDDPVVLTGDLNACEQEPAVRHLLGQAGSPLALRDSYRALHGGADTGSFHAFGKEKNQCRIDYIMVPPDASVVRAEVLIDGQDGKGYASDHYAVAATLHLRAGEPATR